jgi:hypothetical protein
MRSSKKRRVPLMKEPRAINDPRAAQRSSDSQCGYLDGGHSPRSRITRTVTSIGSARPTLPRVSIRAANSAGVGRATARVSTPRRYSDRETPDIAARAVNVRCTSSGTS